MDKPNDTDRAEKPDALTVTQALTLLAALRALDGRATGAMGPNGPVLEPYDFKGGAIYFAIARNIATLNRVNESWEKTRNDLVRKHFSGKPAAECPPESMEAFQKDAAGGLAEVAVKMSDISTIKFDDLNLDQSKIPASVLAVLLPIITNTPAPEAVPTTTPPAQ